MSNLSTLICLVILGVALDTTFVEANDYRIINGSPAAPGEVPYQVALHTPGNWYICGGVIIHPRKILSSGYCLSGYGVEDVYALVGTVTLDSGGDIYYPSEIIVHNEYSNIPRINDIALFITTEPIVFSLLAHAIPCSQNEIEEGVIVTISGWGVTGPSQTRTNTLQIKNVTTISLEQCRELHPYDEILSSNLCSLSDPWIRARACYLDEGGPVVVNGQLVGIISWAYGCGSWDIPDVYTRISSFIDWIDAN